MSADPRPQPPASRLPLLGAFAVGLLASGAVSSATPDGNLVVTLVPGVAAGWVAHALGAWVVRRRSRAR